ncbi:MAG: DUF2249 domain-containing protein [Candidatus Kapabacteria bacterium]|nr:DUF2249 domain-containing protein [Candidatus Kapabacteria bacterium]
MENKKYITPHTTIEELFSDFPEIQESFLKLFPEIANLANPALKEMIYKNTTIEQLSSKNNKNLAETINVLRSYIGLEQSELLNDLPDWLDKLKVVNTLDARPIVMSGGHPIQEVMMSVQSLANGEVFKLITPFQPTPLIDMIGSQGFKVFCEKENDTLFHTYFSK